MTAVASASLAVGAVVAMELVLLTQKARNKSVQATMPQQNKQDGRMPGQDGQPPQGQGQEVNGMPPQMGGQNGQDGQGGPGGGGQPPQGNGQAGDRKKEINQKAIKHDGCKDDARIAKITLKQQILKAFSTSHDIIGKDKWR